MVFLVGPLAEAGAEGSCEIGRVCPSLSVSFLGTACLEKIWLSSYGQNWLSAKEISVFFCRQYFINRLMSGFEFWNVVRHKWKKQGLLTAFLKKLSFGQMGPFWVQISHILITLDPPYKFFQILHNENSINDFSQKLLFRANEALWAQTWCIHVTLDPL